MQESVGQPVGRGSGLVAWGLLVMAVATFAPCVLLPEWRDYQALQLAEEREGRRLERLQRAVEHERRVLEALQSDPAVIARAAQRELGFRAPDERPVFVAAASNADVDDARAPLRGEQCATRIRVPALAAGETETVPPPASLYDRLFCDERTRLILISLSVALMLVALCLPACRDDDDTTRSASGEAAPTRFRPRYACCDTRPGGRR